MSAALAYPLDLSDLDSKLVIKALPNIDDDKAKIDAYEAKFAVRQSRLGEEDRGRSTGEELRALYTSRAFWVLASLLPHNTWESMKPAFGRPRDYPDWLLLLLTGGSNAIGLGSYASVVNYFRDHRNWVDFVNDVDRFVPEGWVQLRQIEHSQRKRTRSKRSRLFVEPRRGSNVIPLQPLRETSYQRSDNLVIVAPSGHHLDYFRQMWKGLRKDSDRTWVPLPSDHAWYGVRKCVLKRFRELAVEQAQELGILDPDQPFQFQKPDRGQAIGMDGTVFSIPRFKTPADELGIELHSVGGDTSMKVGSKFTIASSRVPNQPLSRIIFDFAHTGHAPESRYAAEGDAMVAMSFELRDLTKGGMRMLLADSACRGKDIITLEAGWISVVNYPHAESNRNRKAGKRLAKGRVEKSHLRTIATHTDANGLICEHPIYAVGGVFVERFTSADGEEAVRTLEPKRYIQRGDRDINAEGGPKFGARRQYLVVDIECPIAGNFEKGIPLYHTDSATIDPNYNWGEVCRLFAPGTDNFRFMYGARNDTEARHRDLKSRIKYLAVDIIAQEFRLFGAAMIINAVSLQTHLHGQQLPNVFDDTV